MPLEVTRQVRLVVEPHRRGDDRERFALEEAAAEHVPVRRDPERPREAPHEVRGRGVQDPLGVRERDRLEAVRVEQPAQLDRQPVVAPSGEVVGARAEVRAQTPGTAGLHARTHSRGASKRRRSYKTADGRPAWMELVHAASPDAS